MNNSIQHDAAQQGAAKFLRYPSTGFYERVDEFVNPLSKKQRRPEAPGMYGVQTWSAGPIYPAIIHVEEVYAEFDMGKAVYMPFTFAKAFYAKPLATRLLAKRYVLTIPGVDAKGVFDTRDAAEQYARSQQGRVPS